VGPNPLLADPKRVHLTYNDFMGELEWAAEYGSMRYV
jgi:hypothetical protein